MAYTKRAACVLSASPSFYSFLRGVIILPDELSATVAPPYYVSRSGFVSPDPSKPVLVKLNSKVTPCAISTFKMPVSMRQAS